MSTNSARETIASSFKKSSWSSTEAATASPSRIIHSQLQQQLPKPLRVIFLFFLQKNKNF